MPNAPRLADYLEHHGTANDSVGVSADIGRNLEDVVSLAEA